MDKFNLIIKRIFDLFSSLIGLIILLPVFGVIAILIKLDSKGPVFFKQERLGKAGEVFEIYKFRTMVKNAENKGTGVFTNKSDPRITKVGNLLRKTSLDELPQLINVIKGEMSLVGPRPPVTYHPYKYEDYPEEKKRRFQVKPGITGLAQVEGRNNLSWDERIKYDLKYMERQNLIFDIQLIIKTIFKVFNKNDLYGGD